MVMTCCVVYMSSVVSYSDSYMYKEPTKFVVDILLFVIGCNSFVTWTS